MNSAIIFAVAAIVAMMVSLLNAQQDVPRIYINTTITDQTSRTSDPIFKGFKKTDNSGDVGLGGQILYQFTIWPMTVPMDIQLSTCKGSDFDTYLVLFDRDPTKNETSTVTAENGTMEDVTTLELHQDATVVAESANDILCKESNLRATLEVTLTAGTYYVLVTGDKSAYGTFNLTITGIPNNEYYQETKPVNWYLDRIDQRNLPLDGKYTVDTPTDDVVVYLVDSGVNTAHDELNDGRVQVGYDFVRYSETNTPDCTGHGTHMAGLIAGKTYGVAKQAKIVSLRVYGCSNRASLTTIVNALHWVLAHSRTNCLTKRCVVALMLTNLRETPESFESVLRGFVRRHIPVIVPAGDHEGDIDDNTGDACNVFPANAAGVITVGASTRVDGRASFSNAGSCVDLYAPGVEIKSAWHSSNNGSALVSGTAQATAIVTGVTAVLLSINSKLNAIEVKQFLSSVSTPKIVPAAFKNELPRLVYVRSAPTDRQQIPQKGFVVLQMLLQVNFTVCAIADPLLDQLRSTLADITKVNIGDITVNCEMVPEPTPVVLVEADTSADPPTQRYLANVAIRNRTHGIEIAAKDGAAEEAESVNWSTARQIFQPLNIPVIMTVTERQASIALLKLERKIIEEKEDIEKAVSFNFEVKIMPWAIDSSEVIYWGAPSFPAVGQRRLSFGIIAAIIMGIVLVLCIVGVAAWLWHRKVTHQDDIESMVGSADMEKGPVHFRDFDDDDSSDWNMNRSFRNLPGVNSGGSGRGKEGGGGAGAGLTSLSSFANKDGTEGAAAGLGDGTVRLQSYGGEAFARTFTLGDDDNSNKKAKSGVENDRNWRENNPGRLNSMVQHAGDSDGDSSGRVTLDNIMVRSMGGEAFAMLSNMASQSDVIGANRDDGRERDSAESTGGLRTSRSDVGALQMGFMIAEPDEEIVREGDSVAMSPIGVETVTPRRE